MSPDELRAAAEKLTTPFHSDDRVVSAPDDREWWAALKTARDATRSLADVIEYAERGDGYQGFLSCDKVLGLARGDTTNEKETR